MDRRTRARELAMQGLYQLDVQGESLLEHLCSFMVEREPDDSARKMAWEWTRGAWRNLAECDELIERAMIKWEMSRLAQVDKSILRLSVYQLKFCKDIPPKVVINEAIEMAKKFSTAQSPGFVNGVLDGILKMLEKGDKRIGEPV